MKKLLYINNYNCPVRKDIGITNNHMWGIDKLAEKYDVTYANVPNNIIKVKFKGVTLINNILRNFILLVKYFKFPIVYSACGDMTTAFAFFFYFHLGKRKLYMIQHHGGGKNLVFR